MHLMSASMVSSENLLFLKKSRFRRKLLIPNLSVSDCVFSFCLDGRRHVLRLVPNAKNNSHSHPAKRSWWNKFFSDEDDEIWSGWSADDVLGDDDDGCGGSTGEGASDDNKFEAWRRKAEAISELRDAQEDARNAQGREWEDWLGDDSPDLSTSSWDRDWDEISEPFTDISDDPNENMQEKGLIETVRNLIGGNDEGDLLFEDRVFQYAFRSSAAFIALLVIIPWALDLLVHDYILLPFLDRYVKTVPLAAEMLDVRRHQKLEMVRTLKVERARFQLEVEIGKSPPLSDEEIWLELRHKAVIHIVSPFSSFLYTHLTLPIKFVGSTLLPAMLELRDELRLENRKAFANIWSDMVYGISLFILIYSNKSKVALLKFTGYKLLNSVSDTGKAFLIILITDIFLGYHSESGWQALVEIVLEHYGLEVDPAAITIFICFVPVVIDAFVKLWLFKFLPRLSPNVTNIFREMKRH